MTDLPQETLERLEELEKEMQSAIFKSGWEFSNAQARFFGECGRNGIALLAIARERDAAYAVLERMISGHYLEVEIAIKEARELLAKRKHVSL